MWTNRSIDQSFHDANLYDAHICWIAVDTSIQLVNDCTAKLYGYKSANDIKERGGVMHDELPCKVSEFADAFIAENIEIYKIGRSVNMLGLYCYGMDDWRVMFGTKTPIYDQITNELLGLTYLGQDITRNKFARTAMILLGLDLQYRPKQKLSMASYLIVDSYAEQNLTPSESEVAFYLIRGKTAKEIAQILNRSIKTIHTHVSNIKTKLKCHRKAQITEKLLSLGQLNNIPNGVMNAL